MIFVDSTVLIDILRGRKGIESVIKKNQNALFGISAITIEELYAGLGISKEHLNPISYNIMVQKHEELLQQYQIIPITNDLLSAAGLFRGLCLSKGTTIDSADAIIAVTADLMKVEKLITRNPSHFKFARVPVESYEI